MSESLTKRKLSAAILLLVGGLSLNACSSSPDNSIKVTKPAASSAGHESGPEITYIYHQNGTREVMMDNKGLYYNNATVNSIFEFCDGPDLVEVVENNTPSNWTGGGLTRTVSYPACADGRLTPSDFK